MALTKIRLPFAAGKAGREQLNRVRRRLAEEYSTNVTWYEWGEDGEFWQRFSAQVYLDTDQVKEFGELVLRLIAEDDVIATAAEEEVAIEETEQRSRL